MVILTGNKNTILRGLNNIYNLACELRRDDPRLGAFLQYLAGYCDVLVLHINSEHTLVIAAVACSKLGVTCASG